MGADQVVNGQDPEHVCFEGEKTEIGACRHGLLAGQVLASGFGQQVSERKERLDVVGDVQEAVDDGPEGLVHSLLHLYEVVVVFCVWVVQSFQKSAKDVFVEGGGVGLVRHGCRVSAHEGWSGSRTSAGQVKW